ncbi:xanthine dehydrogenase family protein molybdopterin-binding subunit [Carbonactinospora thermoautotrophica]|uniref:xanthine dehydrogenase family protein molybdopterin-binding subunit n=1 Tax=Carbonactinospora thermoautotrophica TaxID=1469144 RepID=UPI003DA862A5
MTEYQMPEYQPEAGAEPGRPPEAEQPAEEFGIGRNVLRPDGLGKARGSFVFASDIWADGLLWAEVLRSPYPSARIRSIDCSEALRVPGVHAVITQEDLPGYGYFGVELVDQPVFAHEVVRFYGEPVAAVAAEHPAAARRAAARIRVDYELLEPVTDPEKAFTAEPIHLDGNVIRHLEIRHGDPAAAGDVVVEGLYEVAMQDQAFLGPEGGLAIPGEDHVELYVASTWLHSDRDQVAQCLGLEPSQVRLTLAGVGGAFGQRGDVAMQVQLALLALKTGRPVKMIQSREDMFCGHPHRHPARMRYRHHATRDGRLVKVEAQILLDGGAYAATSASVLAQACCFAAGPYVVPNAHIDGYVVRTNNPPAGSMRGHGTVQVAFAYEAQMDKLAAALDMDPVDLRLRNALSTGDVLITGQVVNSPAPVRELLQACADAPMPQPIPKPPPAILPGGAGRTAELPTIRRGTGFAVGIVGLLGSEGYEDYATATVRLENDVALVTCAAAEVGQGFLTLATQIVQEILGVEQVELGPADTGSGSSGPSVGSRQTWVSGGAIEQAAKAVRRKLLAPIGERLGMSPELLRIRDGNIVSYDGIVRMTLAEAVAGRVIEETVTYRPAPTTPLDANGQGDAFAGFAFVAHRAVVDVDPELGLVRVVEVTTAQDVGKVLNPLQLTGQIEGGVVQGAGGAVLEELISARGQVLNPSFTDYLIPTAVDAPDVRIAALVEEAEPGAPFGAKGAGEPPIIGVGAAIAAAIRNATGLELPRMPIRPQDIALPLAGQRAQ